MTERDVLYHTALTDLAAVPEHARLAVGQEGSVSVVDKAEVRRRGVCGQFCGQQDMARRRVLQLDKVEFVRHLERRGQVHSEEVLPISDIDPKLPQWRKEPQAIREAFARGDRAAATQVVSDEMIDTFMLAGTEEERRNRIKSWAGCADMLTFRHTYFDPTVPPDSLPQRYESLFRVAQEA